MVTRRVFLKGAALAMVGAGMVLRRREGGAARGAGPLARVEE